MQQVTVTREDDNSYVKIVLKIGSTKATINSKQVTLSVALFISDEDSTYVPLRFASEALGADVGWEPDNWTAVITQ